MDPEAYNILLEQAQGGDALSAIALELSAISMHLKYLGVGDAATTMGAIEALAMMTKAGLQEVGEGLGAVATAIRDAAEDRE